MSLCNVSQFTYCYAECRHAKCRYAVIMLKVIMLSVIACECHSGECRGAHKTIRIIQFRNKSRVYCTKFTALLDTFFRFVKKPLETRVFIKNYFLQCIRKYKKKCFSKFLLLSMTKTTKDHSYKTVLFVRRVYIGGVKHDVARA